MLKRSWVSFVLVVLLFLNGCGFHLRSKALVPPPLQTLYLETDKPYDSFTLNLEKQLQAFGVKLVTERSQAPYTLHIVKQNFNMILSSISESTLVRTYTLVLSVTFEVQNAKGKVLLPPQTVTTSSSYTSNDNQLLGDNQVKGQEKNQMDNELVFRLLAHLNSHHARQVLP